MFTVNFVIIASSGKSETLIVTVLEFPLCSRIKSYCHFFEAALYVRLPVAANAVIEVVNIKAITIIIAKIHFYYDFFVFHIKLLTILLFF